MSFGRRKLCRSASQTDNGNPPEQRHAHNFPERLAFYLGRFPDGPKLRLGSADHNRFARDESMDDIS